MRGVPNPVPALGIHATWSVRHSTVTPREEICIMCSSTCSVSASSTDKPYLLIWARRAHTGTFPVGPEHFRSMPVHPNVSGFARSSHRRVLSPTTIICCPFVGNVISHPLLRWDLSTRPHEAVDCWRSGGSAHPMSRLAVQEVVGPGLASSGMPLAWCNDEHTGVTSTFCGNAA